MARQPHPDTGKTLGTLACQACGETALLKLSARGLPYYNCDTEKGGCGCQFFARTADAQKAIVARVEKWETPELRRAYLGDDALPKKARKRKDEPEIAPAPEPEADPEGDDPPPADAPPADAPPPKPRKAAKRTPPPVADRPVRLFGKWS